MKQLSLFDVFDEMQSRFEAMEALMEKQSNLSSSITASSKVENVTAEEVADCYLMKQWAEIKEQYPDALLLFRVGAFYEIYNGDAQQASKILCITLTKRGKSSIPFAGFPVDALDKYLPALVRAGKRVAICDEITSIKQNIANLKYKQSKKQAV